MPLCDESTAGAPGQNLSPFAFWAHIKGLRLTKEDHIVPLLHGLALQAPRAGPKLVISCLHLLLPTPQGLTHRTCAWPLAALAVA